MCFNYEVKATLNHKKIGKDTQRTTKIRNCKTRKRPEKVWNKQIKIVLNILFSHAILKNKRRTFQNSVQSTKVKEFL